MSLTDVRPPGEEVAVTRGWRRGWELPIAAHLAALAATLVLLVVVVGTSGSFLADEGAAAIQARSLARGDGWIVEHPMPEVDPAGRHYPISITDSGSRGFAPLAKHPAHTLLLAGAYRLGGMTGIILLSVLGTVVAAGLAASLARRIEPLTARPTVWVVGLGSPLLFDSYLAMGHTLGAALAVGGVLGAARAIERNRPVLALVVVPCVGGAVLVRNEAMLFAGALALVAGIVALRQAPRLTAAMVAVSATGAALAAHLLERAWVAEIVGSSVGMGSAAVTLVGGSFVRGRIDGFVLTWLTPTYGGPPIVVMALLGMTLAVAAGALTARWHPADDRRIGVFAVSAAGCALIASAAAALATERTIVPGLLVAFPLVTAGMALLRRQPFANLPAALAGATSVVFALAVLATQYSLGGTAEWGGRFFALAIPAAVPVLLVALHRQGQVLSPATRRRVAGSLALCTVAIGVLAIGALRASHQSNGRLVAAVERAGAAVDGPGQPVVVSTLEPAPRLAWATFHTHRWLTTAPEDLPDLAARLADAGIVRFVFITSDLQADRSYLGALEPLSQQTIEGRQRRDVLVLGIS